jgi:hypothetical protein
LIDSVVDADYECTDLDAGVELCEGPVADGDPFDTSTVGFHTFEVNAQDYAGNQSSASVEYQVIWPFSGFKPPISNPPSVNEVAAAATVPVRFDLGGNRGLDILEPGYPKSQRVNCTTLAPQGAMESTIAAVGGGLRYEDGNYQYDWKTERNWRGTCREFVLGLIDGSERTALFRFGR